MQQRRVHAIVLSTALVVLAACGSSAKSTGPAATTTTAATAATTAAAPGTASGAACALLTADEIKAATNNSATAAEDDSQAANGEQTCVWTLTGTGTASASGGIGGTIIVNLETGANAVPNFDNLKPGSGIQVETISGIGDGAVLTAGSNLFVKKGVKVVEVSFMGLPVTNVKGALTQLAQAAAGRL